MNANRLGSTRPDRLAIRAVLLARDKRLFFKHDAQSAKEPAHHRGVGFDAAPGPKDRTARKT
jgi:hypothetical protein